MKINFTGRNKTLRGATGIVLDPDRQKILLIKRRDVPIWVPPGGGVERDEEPHQTVVREVFEESGYQVEVLRLVGKYTPSGGTKSNFVFECRIVGGESTLSNESQAVDFFSIDSLPTSMMPIHHRFIKDALQNLTETLEITYKRFTKKDLLRLALKHPHLAFRYFLTKLGIHLDS